MLVLTIHIFFKFNSFASKKYLFNANNTIFNCTQFHYTLADKVKDRRNSYLACLIKDTAMFLFVKSLVVQWWDYVLCLWLYNYLLVIVVYLKIEMLKPLNFGWSTTWLKILMEYHYLVIFHIKPPNLLFL